MNRTVPIVWTIAASDSGGASGITADLATCHGLDVHACSVITAVTAQNSQTVIRVTPVDSQTFKAQIETLKTDLIPSAIKIGLLGSREQVEELIRQLPNLNSYVVLDPVMRATTGSRMDTDETLSGIKNLLPLVDLVTPNLEEAEALTGQPIRTPQDMITATRALHAQGIRGVLLKGGHGAGYHSQDYLSFVDTQGQIIKCGWLVQQRLPVSNTRGTGCTLSSAIAAFVALGEKPEDAVVLASAYVHQGLRTGYQAGQGAGPIGRGAWPDQISDFPVVCDTLNWLDAPAFADCGGLPLGLYPVVDSVEWLEKLLLLGITTCQLRIKGIHGEELDQIIAGAVALGSRYRCRLFINDHWQLAIKHQAYGVHLGQEDIGTADLAAIRKAGLRLGISTHGDFEWARAAALKPSYLALGAVFPTDTKQVKVIGLERLHRWVALLKGYYPLTAIGGINAANLPEVLSSGIDSVAVVSAITKAQDYKQAVSILQNSLLEM